MGWVGSGECTNGPLEERIGGWWIEVGSGRDDDEAGEEREVMAVDK
jgi:hypothetical protein